MRIIVPPFLQGHLLLFIHISAFKALSLLLGLFFITLLAFPTKVW